MDRKPVVGEIPSGGSRVPKPSRVGPDRCFSFGFRYYKQIEYFGLQQVKRSWVSSLLDRLSQLSAEPLDAFLSDPFKQDALRFHDVNWDSKNIPIALEDLDWLPKDYLSNQAEYPMQQFHVSKAMGRFAGFFDENQVFQIVLIDPLHNLQPAGDFNYRVRSTDPVACEYTKLLGKIDDALKSATCSVESCSVAETFRSTPFIEDFDALLLRMPEGDREMANSFLKQGAVSTFYEIFNRGLLTLLGSVSVAEAVDATFPDKGADPSLDPMSNPSPQ